MASTVSPVFVSESNAPRKRPQKDRRHDDQEIEKRREAFRYTSERSLDNEKAIRSIAFLLEWGSDIGNSSLDGVAAYGLATLLHQAADDVRQHELFLARE